MMTHDFRTCLRTLNCETSNLRPDGLKQLGIAEHCETLRILAKPCQTTQLGPPAPSFTSSEAGRLAEKKGADITRPRYQETMIRYNESDGVSSLVHKPAFGIGICFGSDRGRRALAVLERPRRRHR